MNRLGNLMKTVFKNPRGVGVGDHDPAQPVPVGIDLLGKVFHVDGALLVGP